MSDTQLKVYVLNGRNARDFSDCGTELARISAQLEVLPFTNDENEVIEQTHDADALIVASSLITRRVLQALKKLKVVVRTGVGYDVIDVLAATECGIAVVNIPDLWVREVANHALGLLLAWNRKIIDFYSDVKAGAWSSRFPITVGSLHGETVGIVGLGNIGSAFAKRASALEMQVIAHDPYVSDAHFEALGVERVSLEALAERADYVSVHCLLNDATRGLINADFLRRMKPTACLINTSRGPVVDEQALIHALQTEQIAGVALDVLEHEPTAPDNPLLSMAQVILTPHAAFYSDPAVAQVPKRCGEEVARVLSGQRPINLVNPEVYA